jgi:hypothetical protein
MRYLERGPAEHIEKKGVTVFARVVHDTIVVRSLEPNRKKTHRKVETGHHSVLACKFCGWFFKGAEEPARFEAVKRRFF